MRKLTIQNDFRSSQIPAKLFIIENKISAQLPSFFKDLLFMVEGSTIKENVYYDKERKCFHTLTGALIIYKNDNYAAIENVYVKKVGKNFRIINITTDDRFGYIRGSSVKGLP